MNVRFAAWHDAASPQFTPKSAQLMHPLQSEPLHVSLDCHGVATTLALRLWGRDIVDRRFDGQG